MPKYEVTEEIEHEGIRYYPGDAIELTDKLAEFHGLAQSLVSPDKKPQAVKKIDNVGLALTRSEEQSDDN